MSLPEGWEIIDYKKSFTQLSTTHKKVKTKDCNDSGKFPVIDQGQESICGYLDDEKKLIEIDKPVIIFGDHTRVIKWVDYNFIPGADGTKILQPKDIFFPRFFYYQMRNINLPDKGYSRHFKFLKEVDFLLPPLTEQKQIAQKLDKLLARVERIKTVLDNTPARIKRFRQSVLASAVGGELSEGKDWEKVEFKILVKSSSNGLSKRNGEEGNDIVVLRLADYKNGVRVVGKERLIKLTEKEQKKYILQKDDILVVRVNGSKDITGLFTIYNNKNEAYCDHFIRLSLDTKKILPQYSLYVANSLQGRDYIEHKLVSNAGQNTINQKSLLGLPIPLPPLEEQKAIVKKVETLFAIADKMEANLTEAKKQVDRLTQSILAKAFRGELL